MSSQEKFENFNAEDDQSSQQHNLPPTENEQSLNQTQSNFPSINKSTLESSLNSIPLSARVASSSNQQSSNHFNNSNQRSSNHLNDINQHLSNHSNNMDDIKYDNIELEKREELIGEGSYGKVYKRKEKNKEKYYAEKIVEKKRNKI